MPVHKRMTDLPLELADIARTFQPSPPDPVFSGSIILWFQCGGCPLTKEPEECVTTNNASEWLKKNGWIGTIDEHFCPKCAKLITAARELA